MGQPTESQLVEMANKLRAWSIKMTTAAGSGHPSTCCSMAEIMSVLFFDQMQFDPKNPHAHNADQFVISKGHAAPILWAALYEAGAITEDPMNLRKLTSDLEGHPTPRVPWIRVATGSLGQGLSAACGIALAKHLEGILGQVFVVLGDGELAEGSIWEAAQFACHYELNAICATVDLNRLGQSGTSYYKHNTASIARRFASFGWQALVVDGHNVTALRNAYVDARNNSGQPTVIIAKTLKGKGLSIFENADGWHGKPVPVDQLEASLQELGQCDITIDVAPRHTGPDRKVCVCAKHGDLEVPRYEQGQQVATREAYGNALVRLAKAYPKLVALDADTKNSTFSQKLLDVNPARFVECFIAEQNMVGVALGFASMGWIPCTSTFACFLSRAYDFIRMGVISFPQHLVLCGSHAGVSIGEDGPSQMALEDVAMMRGLVESTVVYPCDAMSTERLMEALVECKGVSYLRTSRPKTPVIYSETDRFPIGGSKVLTQSDHDCCTVVAAGVTVHEALTAYDQLKGQGKHIRVIDAYSIKPLDVQTITAAAMATGRVVTVEDHGVCGGLGDAVCQALAGKAPVTLLGVREVPRSGTPTELMAKYGIDAAAIVKAVQQ